MLKPFFILVTFFTGLLFVKLAKITAEKFNIVDRPESSIKLHKNPTPYLGGLGFILNSVILFVIYDFIKTGVNFNFDKKIYVILLLSLFVMIMGVIDDIKRIKPITKIIIISILIFILFLFDIRLKIIYLPKFLNYFLTYFWILGITNAFNLIDIMDGLCGGIAAISSFFLFFTSQSSSIFLIFLSISLISFLIYNFPPAKIFMGDTGSLTIGFLLASFSILGSYGHNNRLALISPILILWLPIYETILVSVLRIKKGKSPLMGSKDHFAFRLKALGFPTLAILIISYCLSIIMGETAFLAAYMPFDKALVVYFLLAFFFLIFFYLLSLIDIKEL